MKVSGTAVLHATPDRVWQAINDPAVLVGVIPGCDQFLEVGDGHFTMTVTLGVASIKGSYSGEVKLFDKLEPVSLTMRATGAGGPGTIDTTVAVLLTDGNNGTTTVDYDADAIVGGMVGGVGQRVLSSVARKTAGKFFAAIDDVLTGARPAGTVPETATGSAGRMAGPHDGVHGPVGDVTEPQPGFFVPAQVGPLSLAVRSHLPLIGAAVVGAASMLVGVLVGARIASRR